MGHGGLLRVISFTCPIRGRLLGCLWDLPLGMPRRPET